MNPPRLPNQAQASVFQQPAAPQAQDIAQEAMSLSALVAPNHEADSAICDESSTEGKKRKRTSMDDPAGPDFSGIDSIISQKRKPREKTACHPCRKRKVGCDRKHPCQTCIERRHPEVCLYESPADTAPFYVSPGTRAGSADTVAIPATQLNQLLLRIDSLEHSVRELTADIRTVLTSSTTNGFANSPVAEARMRHRSGESEEAHQHREGIHTNNPVTGQIVHLGGNSVPALLMSLARSQDATTTNGDSLNWKELLNGAVLPLLGLDNESATYPFIDLWSTPDGLLAKIKRLAEVIPPEAECRTYFSAYSNIAQNIFPGLADVKEFEADLMQFHLRRVQLPIDSAITEQSIYGMQLTWVALLFSVLASGCHFSDTSMDKRSRELTSKVFVCCSFECLRLSNFLSNPNIEAIQAMVIFLNTLLNLYQAGVVWGMLGLIIRLAQSLGLHQRCPPSTPFEKQNRRAKIWWSIVWQDSLVSITYDRAGTAMGLEGPMHLPPELDVDPGQWAYGRCMYRLCAIGLNIVRERHTNTDPHVMLLRMNEHEHEIAQIDGYAANVMRDLTYGSSLKDRIQHHLYQLHKSYMISELCRAAISPGAPQNDLARRMRQTCIECLSTTVNSWIHLYRVARMSHRSWPAMHRALSSALLLGILKEDRDPHVLTMLADLLRALEEVTARIPEAEVVPPLQRSIVWLRKLMLHPQSLSTSSSPAIPSLGSEDSPYAFVDRMMWPSAGTP